MPEDGINRSSHPEPAHEQQREDAAGGEFESGFYAEGIELGVEGELSHAIQPSIGDAIARDSRDYSQPL
jgi:hypothetical protein